MTKEEFLQQWDRLLNNLETGGWIDERHIKGRCIEAWQAFKQHTLDRFREIVSVCIQTPGRRFFPTVGELRECEDDSEQPRDTMDPATAKILADPEQTARLEQETQDWFRNEILPMCEDKTVMLGGEKSGALSESAEGIETTIPAIDRRLVHEDRERLAGSHNRYLSLTPLNNPVLGSVDAASSDIQPMFDAASEGPELFQKGRAMVLASKTLGETVWFVADEEDAQLLREPRGTVYTASEAVSVATVARPETIAEIHRWKRALNATITEAHKLSE